MTKSVIGGFQKMSKRKNKSYFEEQEIQQKKHKKIRRINKKTCDNDSRDRSKEEELDYDYEY